MISWSIIYSYMQKIFDHCKDLNIAHSLNIKQIKYDGKIKSNIKNSAQKKERSRETKIFKEILFDKVRKYSH